jgi:hypothetical protein
MAAALLITVFTVVPSYGDEADVKSGEQINWQVISSGSQINGSSTNFLVSGTVGQTAVGRGTSTNFIVIHGFWQDFGEGPTTCCDVPGDANNDGTVNILDITYLINYLYLGGPAPPCMYEGDANGDCSINILDITYLISYLYQGGPAPVCAASCPGW